MTTQTINSPDPANNGKTLTTVDGAFAWHDPLGSVSGTVTNGALLWDGASWTNNLVIRSNLAAGFAAQVPLSGTGSPEGVQAANVGTLYLRTNGGAGTTLYVKESGVSTTGWVAK